MDLLEAAPDSESSEKAFATTMLRSVVVFCCRDHVKKIVGRYTWVCYAVLVPSKFKSLRFFGLFAVTTVLFLGAAVLGVLVCRKKHKKTRKY